MTDGDGMTKPPPKQTLPAAYEETDGYQANHAQHDEQTEEHLCDTEHHCAKASRLVTAALHCIAIFWNPPNRRAHWLKIVETHVYF